MKPRFRLSALGLGLAVLGLSPLLPAFALARTWTILADGSGDAATIQAGIDSAAAGDTVWAQPGLFRENLDFLGKAIVVRGSGMGVTVLDGQGQGSCVVFFNGEGRESILEDFTITGGSGSCASSTGCRNGGGVYVYNSEPTIQRNRFYNNDLGFDPSTWGGGIKCSTNFLPDRTTFPLIAENIIEYNFAGGDGGGISVEGTAAPAIVGNIIRNNEARFGDGGGIAVRSYSGDVIAVQDNVIENNLADDHGGGVHLALGTSLLPTLSINIERNLFVGNEGRGSAQVTSSGGGIWVQEVSGTIANNTFVENRGGGPDSTWGGGGIAISSSPDVVVELNIVAYSTYGGGIRCNGPAPALIRNNFAWQNVGGNGVGTCAAWWQTNGNVVDNPYFCDLQGGDYTVASNSAVIKHPAGPLGAFPIPGCGPVAVKPTTWGRVKALYGTNR